MDFDHVTGTKLGEISNLIHGGQSWGRIATEIDKCELVCANCHRVRTWRRWQDEADSEENDMPSRKAKPAAPVRLTPAMLVERTKLFDVDELRLLDANPNQGDVGALHNSMEQFGQIETILVVDGVVVNGNHRVLTERQARRFDGKLAGIDASGLNLSEMRALAAGLALNRTARLGVDDLEALSAALLQIQHEDEELLTAVGYDLDDLDDILRETAALSGPLAPPDDEPVEATLDDPFVVPVDTVLDGRRPAWRARGELWAKRFGRDRSALDPVLVEVLVRWFSAPEAVVADVCALDAHRGVIEALGRSCGAEEGPIDLLLSRVNAAGDIAAVVAAAQRLTEHRFAAVETAPGLTADLIDLTDALASFGLRPHADLAYVHPASATMLSGREFRTARRLTSGHRSVTVFVLGDPEIAAEAGGEVPIGGPVED